jgi:hypothetical protein
MSAPPSVGSNGAACFGRSGWTVRWHHTKERSSPGCPSMRPRARPSGRIARLTRTLRKKHEPHPAQVRLIFRAICALDGGDRRRIAPLRGEDQLLVGRGGGPQAWRIAILPGACPPVRYRPGATVGQASLPVPWWSPRSEHGDRQRRLSHRVNILDRCLSHRPRRSR